MNVEKKFTEGKFTVEELSDVFTNHIRAFKNGPFTMLYSVNGSSVGVRCVDEIYKKLRKTGNPVNLLNIKLDSSFSVNDFTKIIESINRDPDITNILCLDGIETVNISLRGKILCDMIFDKIYKIVLDKSDVPKNCIVFFPIQKNFIDSISKIVKNRMCLFEL